MGGASWDGRVNGTVNSSSEEKFSLSLLTDTMYPVSQFFELVPVTLNCTTSTRDCRNTVGCLQFSIDSSTIDPFFSWASSNLKPLIEADIFVPAFPRRQVSTTSTVITTLFLHSVLYPGEVLWDDTVGIGNILLPNNSTNTNNNIYSSCRVHYSGLVRQDSLETPDVAHSIFPREDASCNQAEWTAVESGFDEVITALNKVSGNIQQTLSLLNLGYLYTGSIPWLSCYQSLNSFFHAKPVEDEIFTKSCLVPFGDKERKTDACCTNNASLCCIGDNYTNTLYYYDVINNDSSVEDESTCQFPYCFLDVLEAYSEYTKEGTTITKCSDFTDDLLNNDNDFDYDPWNYCLTLLYPGYRDVCYTDATPCINILGPGAMCARSRCYLPCTSDNDCYVGPCTDSYCRDNTTDLGRQEAFSKCLLDHLEPTLRDVMVETLALTSTALPDDVLTSVISGGTCTNAMGFIQPLGMSSKATCTQMQYCDLLSCTIGDPNFPYCTSQNCQYDLYGCWQRNSDYNWYQLGVEPHCELRTDDTGQTAVQVCTKFGGKLSPYYQFLQTATGGKCYSKAASKPSDCYPDTCIPTLNSTVPCISYCVSPTISSSLACSTAGYTWQSWTGPATGTPQSACVIPAKNLTNCTGQNGSWVMGYDFSFTPVNSSNCAAHCANIRSNNLGNVINTPLSECERPYCNGCPFGSTLPNCTNASLCTPRCSEPASIPCLLSPKAASRYGLCIWSPQGCIFGFGNLCTAFGGRVLDLSDQNKCLGFASICQENPNLVTLSGNNVDPGQDTPAGISLKNREECTKCGFNYTTFYTWKDPGIFRSIGQIKHGEWKIQGRHNTSWIPFPDLEKWTEILEQVKAARVASYSVSELYCKFGSRKEFTSLYVCNCYGTDTDECASRLVSRAGIVIGGVEVCEGQTRNQRVSDLVFEVGENFSADGHKCTTLTATKSSQIFLRAVDVDISSLSVLSSTRRTLNSRRFFVYNTNGVVVGNILDNGYGIKTPSASLKDLNVCTTLPTDEVARANWVVPAELSFIDFAWYDEYQDTYVPFGLEVRLDGNNNRSICFGLNSTVLFFPVGLIEDYTDTRLQDSWTSPEMGLFIFCDVMYFILLCIVIYSFVSHFYLWVKKDSGAVSDLFNTAVIALSFLFLLVLLRFVYFMSLPFGIFDNNYGAVVVFSDLPTLLYFFVCAYTAATWFSIYNSAKKLKERKKDHSLIAASLVVGSLCLIWIAFVIAFGQTKDDVVEATCVNPAEEGLKTSDKISLAYKVIFAFYAVCLATFVLIIGWKFGDLVVSRASSKTRPFVFLGFVTVCTTCALLAQAAIAIASIKVDMSNVLKISLIIAFDLFPVYGLFLLFEDHRGLSVLVSDASSIGTSKHSGASAATSGGTGTGTQR